MQSIGRKNVRGGNVPRSIPEGRRLHHNYVHHHTSSLCGAQGFRAWTEPKGSPLNGSERCPCGWSGLPHYAWDVHVKFVREHPDVYPPRQRAQ